MSEPMADEFGPWLEEKLRDPEFRALYEAAEREYDAEGDDE